MTNPLDATNTSVNKAEHDGASTPTVLAEITAASNVRRCCSRPEGHPCES